jgi:hypothetical protein
MIITKNELLFRVLAAGLLVCAAGAQVFNGGVDINTGGGGTPAAGTDVTRSGAYDLTAYTNAHTGSAIAYVLPAFTHQTVYSGAGYGPSITQPTNAGTYQVQVVTAFEGSSSYTNSSTLVIGKGTQPAVAWNLNQVATTSKPRLTSSGRISGGSGTGIYEFKENPASPYVVLSGTGNRNADFTAGWTPGDDADKTVTLAARRLGDANWNDGPWVDHDLTIKKKTQTAISWVDTSYLLANGSINISQLVSGGTGSGAWTYEAVANCTLSGTTLSWNTSDITVRARKAGDTQYKTGAWVSKVYSVLDPITPIIPKTGQTVAYVSGDDGAKEIGIAWPNPRFTNHGNGTITDNLTGLMWQRVPTTTLRTYWNSYTYCRDLTLGGRTDWRMPTIRELQSLVNYSKSNSGSWLGTQGFSGVSGKYWSSTQFAGNFAPNPSRLYYWDLKLGRGETFTQRNTHNNKVMAVRGP